MNRIDIVPGSVDAGPVLTKDEEHALFARYRAGDAAAGEELARKNLRLVIRIAQTFCRRGGDVESAFLAGSDGLRRAMEDFDHERGIRFSTYAGWWIRHSVRIDVATDRLIHVPHNLVHEVRKARRLGPEALIDLVGQAHAVMMSLAGAGDVLRREGGMQLVDAVARSDDREAIRRLEDEDQLGWVLGHFEGNDRVILESTARGLSCLRVARALGCSRSYVTRRLHRLIQRARAIAAEAGHLVAAS